MQVPASQSSGPFEELLLGSLLGKGSFGSVYRGLHHGRRVAVKVGAPNLNPEFLTLPLALLRLHAHSSCSLVLFLGVSVCSRLREEVPVPLLSSIALRGCWGEDGTALAGLCARSSAGGRCCQMAVLHDTSLKSLSAIVPVETSPHHCMSMWSAFY